MSRPRPSLALRRAAAVLGIVTLCSACRASVDVGITTERDGSGVVRVTARLDAEAARTASITGMRPRVDDLVGTGWTMSEPKTQADGSVVYVAQRAVGNAAEAQEALAQLGPPFAGLRVTRSHSIVQTTTRVAGTVDLSRGLESFGDETVRQRLGGTSDLGLDATAIERQTGQPIAELVRVAVRAQVPGAAPATWAPAVGARTPIELVGSVRHLDVVARLAGGAVIVLAAAALALAQRRVRRRRASYRSRA